MPTDEEREAVVDAVTETSGRVRDALALVTADVSLAISLAAVSLLLGATVGTWPDAGDGAASADIVSAWFQIGRNAAMHVPEGATKH